MEYLLSVVASLSCNHILSLLNFSLCSSLYVPLVRFCVYVMYDKNVSVLVCQAQHCKGLYNCDFCSFYYFLDILFILSAFLCISVLIYWCHFAKVSLWKLSNLALWNLPNLRSWWWTAVSCTTAKLSLKLVMLYIREQVKGKEIDVLGEFVSLFFVFS